MKILFKDGNFQVAQALAALVGDHPDFEVSSGQILPNDPNSVPDVGAVLDTVHKADAIVSPANSFGWMDGGIDAAYIAYFGPGLQVAVHDAISKTALGEVLVGEAIMVPTGNPHIPNLIVAPTMPVPQPISAHNVYLAARAAVAMAAAAGFSSIVMPGMGTGSGVVAPHVAAPAMLNGILDGLATRDPAPRLPAASLNVAAQALREKCASFNPARLITPQRLG